MDFSKKNRERKRTIGKSEPRRMEPKIDEAALDAKIAAIRESNRHFFCWLEIFLGISKRNASYPLEYDLSFVALAT